MVDQRSGCKVGWQTFTTEAEAKACSEREHVNRERMFAQGYDFGFQWPGSIRHEPNHPEHGEVWIVVTT